MRGKAEVMVLMMVVFLLLVVMVVMLLGRSRGLLGHCGVAAATGIGRGNLVQSQWRKEGDSRRE